MIGNITVKICGLTRREDAEAAAAIGADYLGFIFHEKSPRNLSAEKFRSFAADLPNVKKVAVAVEPDALEVGRLAELGFDLLQLHFRPESEVPRKVAGLASFGPRSIWLAPRLPPGTPLNADWLNWSAAILLDAYSPDKFGGTGHTGDWEFFRRHRTEHPGRPWILSGGLTPENVPAALAATGAAFIDVNSGVEAAPGLKDPARLKALAAVLAGGSTETGRAASSPS